MRGARRHRYIAFHIRCEGDNPPIVQPQFVQALRHLSFVLYSTDIKDLRVWVVYFDGTRGILKCRHTEKERVINLLCSLKKIDMVPVTVTTISTSGTIHGLKQKHQEKAPLC